MDSKRSYYGECRVCGETGRLTSWLMWLPASSWMSKRANPVASAVAGKTS